MPKTVGAGIQPGLTGATLPTEPTNNSRVTLARIDGDYAKYSSQPITAALPGLASFCRERFYKPRFKPVWQKQVSASFCQSDLFVAEKLYNFLMIAAVISHLCANQLLTQMIFLHRLLV